MKYGITVTAEFLPSELNIAAYWKSRNSLDSSEWILSHHIFQIVFQIKGFLEIDLLALCLPLKIPTYIAWKPDSQSHATDTFQQNWTQILVCFSSILHDSKVLSKELRGKVLNVILITPVWTTEV